jgi:hypothetical protein
VFLIELELYRQWGIQQATGRDLGMFSMLVLKQESPGWYFTPTLD